MKALFALSLLALSPFAAASEPAPQTLRVSGALTVTECDPERFETEGCALSDVKPVPLQMVLKQSEGAPGRAAEVTLEEKLANGATAYSTLHVLVQNKAAYVSVATRLMDSKGVLVCSSVSLKNTSFRGKKTDLTLEGIALCKVEGVPYAINGAFKN